MNWVARSRRRLRTPRASERSTSALKITRPGRRQDQLAVPAVLDRLLEPDLLRLDRELDLLLVLEPLSPSAAASQLAPTVVFVRSCSQYVR